MNSPEELLVLGGAAGLAPHLHDYQLQRELVDLHGHQLQWAVLALPHPFHVDRPVVQLAHHQAGLL